MRESIFLSDPRTYRVVGDEQRFYASNETMFFMLLWCGFMLSMPLALIFYFLFFVEGLFKLQALFGVITLPFVIYFTVPILYQVLTRGRRIAVIRSGELFMSGKRFQLSRVRDVKEGSHPNPLRLWVFSYLILTDERGKKHYFNTYKLIRVPSLLAFIERNSPYLPRRPVQLVEYEEMYKSEQNGQAL